MKKLIEFIKNDYAGVKWTLQNQFRFKLPDWAILLYYCVVVALFWPLMVLVWIGFRIWIWHMLKEIKKMERD